MAYSTYRGVKMEDEMVLLIRDDDTVLKRAPMWVRVIVAAIAECGDDESAFVEMRKAFYLLPPELQKRLVKAAYDYHGNALKMVRQLINAFLKNVRN